MMHVGAPAAATVMHVGAPARLAFMTNASTIGLMLALRVVLFPVDGWAAAANPTLPTAAALAAEALPAGDAAPVAASASGELIVVGRMGARIQQDQGIAFYGLGLDLRYRWGALIVGTGVEGHLGLGGSVQVPALAGLNFDLSPVELSLVGLFGPRHYEVPHVSDTLLFAGARAELNITLRHPGNVRHEFLGLVFGWEDDLSRKRHEYSYVVDDSCIFCEADPIWYDGETTLGWATWFVGANAGTVF